MLRTCDTGRTTEKGSFLEDNNTETQVARTRITKMQHISANTSLDRRSKTVKTIGNNEINDEMKMMVIADEIVESGLIREMMTEIEEEEETIREETTMIRTIEGMTIVTKGAQGATGALKITMKTATTDEQRETWIMIKRFEKEGTEKTTGTTTMKKGGKEGTRMMSEEEMIVMKIARNEED